MLRYRANYYMHRALIQTAPKAGERTAEQRAQAAGLLIRAYEDGRMGADPVAEIRADLKTWEASR